MRIVCVPVLDDNFSYLLIDEMGVTAAVDPAEPEKVSCPLYGSTAAVRVPVVVRVFRLNLLPGTLFLALI